MKEQIIQDALVEARDHKTRRLMIILSAVAAVSFLVALLSLYQVWRHAQAQAIAGRTLAAQVKTACAEGLLDDPEMVVLCNQAARIEKLAGYPVSWTFTIGDQSWLCDDEDLDHNYICRLQ